MKTSQNKILFFVGSLKGGGTERVAFVLGKELLNRSVPVSFLTINNVVDYEDEIVAANTYSLNAQNITNKLIKGPIVFFRLISFLLNHKPQYLVSFSMKLNILSFFTFHRRIIFTIEANLFIYKVKTYRRYLQKFLSVLPNIKYVIVPSKGLFDACHSYFWTKKKLINIPNPVDLSNINELKNEPIAKELESEPFILSAGRLVRSKGFEQLIKVFAKSKIAKDKKLLILGDGPEKFNLEKLIITAGLEKRVILKGFEKNPFKYFYRAELFVLNSRHESFGNVIIESLACGTPVISNDCNFGPRDIITHGENGILYDQSNDVELERALGVLFDDKEELEIMRIKAESTSQLYSADNIADKWLAMLKIEQN